MATPSEQRPARVGWQEVLVTGLLVLAAVATSWSSYQATRWNGEQALAAGRTSGIRIEAARTASLGEAQTQVDVATFIAWSEADRTGDRDLADYFVDRFRPEFKTAFDAWVATDPLTDSTAPATPFAMPEYQVAARNAALRLDAQADVSAATVQRNVLRASNYVLSVVLYATALFFAGISTKIGSRRLRTVLVACGWAVFLGTVVWVATFPVSVQV
ncbi:hypothetical protein EKO23_01270 [Nocardioides guangzhouensis]|uniref:Uncharacterized protein n=1 Tax=Nocardioides guangzhouensis TaxID=2497878 RepID=A0A4Q4ZMB9_9ACTN|nr:hypothetical protein [Nocardioides guangzhouensis]RYP89085.1 hypothetical protein EKO23_01270 [Nocardioides guangzhouensis]